MEIVPVQGGRHMVLVALTVKRERRILENPRGLECAYHDGIVLIYDGLVKVIRRASVIFASSF
jgi:hypothetical protein